MKIDSPRILAWFIINYFHHNLDLISQAIKKSRPQRNDGTKLAYDTDYVWDPERSHVFLIYQMISEVQRLQPS